VLYVQRAILLSDLYILLILRGLTNVASEGN